MFAVEAVDVFGFFYLAATTVIIAVDVVVVVIDLHMEAQIFTLLVLDNVNLKFLVLLDPVTSSPGRVGQVNDIASPFLSLAVKVDMNISLTLSLITELALTSSGGKFSKNIKMKRLYPKAIER